MKDNHIEHNAKLCAKCQKGYLCVHKL
jgi:hypothetical protein